MRHTGRRPLSPTRFENRFAKRPWRRGGGLYRPILGQMSSHRIILAALIAATLKNWQPTVPRDCCPCVRQETPQREARRGPNRGVARLRQIRCGSPLHIIPAVPDGNRFAQLFIIASAAKPSRARHLSLINCLAALAMTARCANSQFHGPLLSETMQ